MQLQCFWQFLFYEVDRSNVINFRKATNKRDGNSASRKIYDRSGKLNREECICSINLCVDINIHKARRTLFFPSNYDLCRFYPQLMTPIPEGAFCLVIFVRISPYYCRFIIFIKSDTAVPIGDQATKLQPVFVALFFFFHSQKWARAKVICELVLVQ